MLVANLLPNSVSVIFLVCLFFSPSQQNHDYRPAPSYKGHDYKPYEIPRCAKNTTETFCLSDYDYPSYEVKKAIEENFAKFDQLYADVLDQSTKDSVDRLERLEEETYLCPSDTIYSRPLRAVNAEGKWRILVNYEDSYKKYTQTVRVEMCRPSHEGKPCPKIPLCYDTRCVQKNVYHRMIVFDPYGYKFPFAIESFKLPASCACYQGGFEH